MRYKAVFLFLLFLFKGLSLSAQNPHVYILDGIIQEEFPAVLEPFSNESGKSLASLQQYFASEGYFNAEVKLQNDTLRVQRNCSFDLLTELSGNNAELILPKAPEEYSDSKVESYMNAIIQRYREEGYLNASLRIDRISIQNQECKVTMHFRLEAGPVIYADRIQVQGISENENRYLNRRAGVRDSLPTTRRSLSGLRNTLSQTGWFRDIRQPEVIKVGGQYVVFVEGVQRPQTEFEGLLGYVPTPQGEGQVVGDLRLNIRNAISPGNSILFTFRRLRPETSELDLDLQQDWIGDVPVQLGTRLYLYQNDTTYQARNFRLNSGYELFPGFLLYGTLDFQSTTSGSSEVNVTEPDGNKRTATLGFRLSTLDNLEVPRSGAYIDLSYGRALKSIESDTSFTLRQNILQAMAEKYVSVDRRSVIAFRSRAFFLDASAFTLHDLYRFGGANSFRGYAEQQFRASLMAWTDIEYRYLTDPYSYLFVFGAVGGYRRPTVFSETNNTFAQQDYLYSTGFGLSYRIAIGRLKFTYAISPSDPIANGKVHLSVVTSF